jgi:hypothetical protein
MVVADDQGRLTVIGGQLAGLAPSHDGVPVDAQADG